MKINFFTRVLHIYIPILIAVTLVIGIEYSNAQQILRLGANEPQVWLAEDVISHPPDTGVHIAIESDPAPYVLIYDETGHPVSGTGYLHGVLPTLPEGVLQASMKEGTHMLTWQPEPGVREALVIQAIPNGGYAVSGRSLAYTEQQETLLLERTVLGWVGSAILLLITVTFLVITYRKEPIH